MRLNGTRVTELNHYVDLRQARDLVLLVDGRPVALQSDAQVVLLHKPRGVVCSHRTQSIRGRRLQTVFDLVPAEYASWFFAGRLDVSSEGLVVLSNDGDHVFMLTHPTCGTLKQYAVRTSRPLSQDECRRALRGVTDKGERLRFEKMEPQAVPAEYHVWLTEGRNREIRRLLERLGVRVRRLVRLQLGPYALGALPVGQWIVQPKAALPGKPVSHLTHTGAKDPEA